MFGASGDLTARKLLPALASLAGEGSLPDGFGLIGVARTEWSDDEFRDHCLKAVPDAKPVWTEAVKRFRYVPGNYDDDATFAKVTNVLGEYDSPTGSGGHSRQQDLLPRHDPVAFRGGRPVVSARHGLNKPGPGGKFSRLVIEKPFGRNLATAMALDETLHECFEEHQIYRIDHYMGKETVQNVLALRFANSIFEPVWNRRYVGHVHVTVAESIGVEHRGAFYEGAGALRDIVQNHVMQVLALTLMEPSATMDPTSIRDEKVKLLRSIMAPRADEAEAAVVRAQYKAGMIDGQERSGLPGGGGREPPVDDRDLRRDAAVGGQLALGGRAGVHPHRKTPRQAFHRGRDGLPASAAPALCRQARPRPAANALILRIQPDEGITLRFGAKVPGQDYRVRTVAMDFSYKDAFGTDPPEAYERLLLDAMIGDPTLFIRTDEVEQAWRLLEPVQEAFAEGYPHLSVYNAGTWGPLEAARLLEPEGYEWVNP